MVDLEIFESMLAREGIVGWREEEQVFGHPLARGPVRLIGPLEGFTAKPNWMYTVGGEKAAGAESATEASEGVEGNAAVTVA